MHRQIHSRARKSVMLGVKIVVVALLLWILPETTVGSKIALPWGYPAYIGIVLIASCLYFVPEIVAHAREHPRPP